MSAEDLIKNGKARVGDVIELLWRDKLTTPFSQQICFGEDGKATSGACTATRIKGGWALVDNGGEQGKGHDVWQATDDDESEALHYTFSTADVLWYKAAPEPQPEPVAVAGGKGADGCTALDKDESEPPAPGPAAEPPAKKPRKGSRANMHDVYRCAALLLCCAAALRCAVQATHPHAPPPCSPLALKVQCLRACGGLRSAHAELRGRGRCARE